jgi:hypothetical protein
MATAVIMERYITSTRDMDDIEAAITSELKGENHRCAFLRSQSYLLLRMAALYKSDHTPYTIYHDGVSVSLDWTSSGKRVTLRSVDLRAYADEEQEHLLPSSSRCDDPPVWEHRKALRQSAL